jgi:alkylation response protein AidB-like acyl-CoA dehydrogenase
MRPGEEINGGYKKRSSNPEAEIWLQRMASRGWTAPTWPANYGGGGLNKEDFLILLGELQRINARPPLGGMGISMIGPTLLEYGTDEQKARHLPPIIKGELAWCQGYSEPGAGSDLASLRTKAEDKGDVFLVNGSKIWTSGANHADWIFCLVRTNPDAPKHEGISFILFSMDSPGVTVKPIRLINGHSPFCETFFDNVEVPKRDLVHKLNQGWSVAKRLLQHERSGLAALASGATAGPMERISTSVPLQFLAAQYNADHDLTLRDEITRVNMQIRAFTLTQQRTVQESEVNTPGAATSIFKYVEAEVVKQQLETQLKIRGSQGLGWEGEMFNEEEQRMLRLALEAKAISIAGGSNEIQLNIIAKRVLGLPD